MSVNPWFRIEADKPAAARDRLVVLPEARGPELESGGSGGEPAAGCRLGLLLIPRAPEPASCDDDSGERTDDDDDDSYDDDDDDSDDDDDDDSDDDDHDDSDDDDNGSLAAACFGCLTCVCVCVNVCVCVCVWVTVTQALAVLCHQPPITDHLFTSHSSPFIDHELARLSTSTLVTVVIISTVAQSATACCCCRRRAATAAASPPLPRRRRCVRVPLCSRL